MSGVASTPTVISVPSWNRCASTRRSYFDASTRPEATASASRAMVSPMVEPSRTGLITSGRPYFAISCSTVSADTPSLTSNSSNSGTSRPAAVITEPARALSMHSADASTPEPVYGRPSSSSIPCTVPSSPSLPCNALNTQPNPPSRSTSHVLAELAQRGLHLGAGLQRHLALGGPAAAEHGDLHFQRPTSSTSVSSSTLKRRFTSARTCSMSAAASFAFAPPSLTMKLPCSVETIAAPWRTPLSHADCTRRPAESPGGFLNTLPQFLVLIGCVSLRSAVSLAIIRFASSPSPRWRCTVASTTSAPLSGPSRNAEVRYARCRSFFVHVCLPLPGTKPATSTSTSFISRPQQPAF